MKHSQKILALLLTTAMITPSVQSLNIKAQAKYNTSKLSNQLLQEISTASKNEKLPVVIWTTDINQKLVEYDAEKATGIDATEYYSETNSEALKTLSVKDGTVTESSFKQYLKETRKERKEQLKETSRFNKAKRSLAKEKYIELNNAFADDNMNKSDVTFSSNYAPMIIANVTPKQIEKISNRLNVVSIDLYSDAEKEAEDQLTVAKGVINTTTISNNYDLDGTGVKIGLIESGCPKKDNNELKSSDITNLSSNTTDHATMTSAIIAGSNGIAPKAKIFSIARGSNLYGNIETLLDKNVNLISMSNGSDSGNYGNIPKWIDHVVAQHNVSFIASAGNSGINGNVCDSGMGYNAIAVGAIDDKNTSTLSDDVIASYTSRVSNAATKPEIYAPGSNITVAGMTNSGTSFSCPMVSGMAALLIDAFPMCGRLPSLLKATLIASGRNLNNGSYDNVSSITSNIGAGVVRATTAYQALKDNNIDYGWLGKGYSSWNQTITPKKTGVCRFCLVWIKDNKFADGSNHSDYTNITDDTFINLDVKVSDKNNRVIASGNATNNTFELCQFTAVANETYTVNISAPSKLAKNVYFSYVYLQ